MFLHEQMTFQVDIQAISEHCLDTTRYQVAHDSNAILRQHFQGQGVLQLNSSTEQAINQYKPGGTGIVVLGPTVSRLEPHGRGGDGMGRWSFVHLRRRNMPPITVISVYQVCKRPTNILGNTAYHQQYRALQSSGRHNVHPRQAFIEDLSSFVGTLQQKGHDIILGGDFNETLDERNSGVLRLATTRNLTDPFVFRYPHHHDFGTFHLGRRRIDIMLVSPRILPSIQRIGYAPFQFTNSSDHRPLLLDFNTRQLFGEYPSPLQPVHSRAVRSNDKRAVHKFVTIMYDE